jgi:hypothetical protein
MDPLKTPSSSTSNDDDKSKDEPAEMQGVPPVESTDKPAESSEEKTEDKPEESVEVAQADTDKPADDSSDTTDTNDSAVKPDVTASTDGADDATKTDASSDAPASSTDDTSASDDTTAAPAPAASAPVVPGLSGAASASVAPKKSRKKLLLISLVAVLVVLLGGAAAAYQYMLTKPENVLKMALANSLSKDKVKSMHFSGELDVEEQGNDMSLGATFTGAANNTSGAFDLSGKLDVYVTNITFDARSVDGKSAFIRVGGLEGLPELLAAGGSAEVAQLYAPMIAAVNNQWFEINESLTKELGVKEGTLSDADVKKLKDAYQKHTFLVVKEKLANEKVKGVDSYHYKVVVDKAKLKSFMGAVADAKLSSLELKKEDVTNFNKSLDDVDFNKYPFEVWISKGDKLINQVSFSVKEDKTTAKFRFTVDSFNKEVKVEKPEGAKSILELLGSFYGGASGSGSSNLEFDESALQGLDSGISL